jgi:hypothetical protein
MTAARIDRVARVDVPGNGRSEDQCVLVRTLDRPRSNCSSDRQPPTHQVATSRLETGVRRSLAHGPIRIEDQRCEQFIAARKVAVHRRRDHARLVRNESATKARQDHVQQGAGEPLP